jgi:hypothetical protein
MPVKNMGSGSIVLLFLTSALGIGELLASRSFRFRSEKFDTAPIGQEVRWTPEPGLEAMQKFCLDTELNPGRPSRSPSQNGLDRLCGLLVRVPGYRSRGPGSIPDATSFSEVSRTASTQPRE